VVIEVSIPSSMVMLHSFPVETVVGSHLEAAVTMKASSGNAIYWNYLNLPYFILYIFLLLVNSFLKLICQLQAPIFIDVMLLDPLLSGKLDASLSLSSMLQGRNLS
jgi:hypothetical protein